jgi:hypothetical protein
LNFPSAARKIETLKELLAVSDVVSLHCSLTPETMQLINADALQHIKPGIVLSLFGVNLSAGIFFCGKRKSCEVFISNPKFPIHA